MSNQVDGSNKSWKFTGWHMAAIMGAFFGVIFTVNGYMAYVATTSWSGVMARNGYVASQDFNATLAERKRQDRLGYQSELRYDGQAMKFTLSDRDGLPLQNFKIVLLIGRPSHESEDRKIELHEQLPGIYRQKLQLAPGQWNAEVIANEKTDQQYRRLVRLYVKE
ncbi:hypothetical protein A9Q83_04450 [Alphaproteobacteria bacterium 46_93_T64]|nr:hypothetical protein A9Q83_04450 [Alphaproteobacteria bacterium 46_93_T64]